MEQSGVLRRMAEAAEQWAREQLGVTMRAEVVAEPICCPDGSLQSTVQLQSTGDQPKKLRCLVTLEPNGSLACFAPDELS